MQAGAASEQTYSPSWLRFIFGKNPAWTIVRILLVVFVVLILFKFVLLPIRVTGDSMLPNFKSGQIKFVNRRAYSSENPKRGDVVAVEFAGQEVLLLKRVVGLPGETFQVLNGEVFVNGKLLEENYTQGKVQGKSRGKLGRTDPIPLGRNEYMVLGDNRDISEGYIKTRKEIIGKVL